MALSDYQPSRHEVKLAGGSFMVRGLALADVGLLVKTHLTDLEQVFDLFEKAQTQVLDSSESRQFALSVAKDAPGLTANLIALAADEPNAAAQAALLAFPVQVDVLIQIGRLTFEEVGGIKKGLLAVADLLGLFHRNKSPEATTTPLSSSTTE